LFFISLACVGAPAQAQQQTERAQYFDPSGQVRAEELAGQAFAPSPAQVRLGLQTGNLWLKLSRTVPAEESLYLYQAHPNAGLVKVYARSTAPAGPGARWPGETLSAKELQGGKLLLPRAATPQRANYYVQIQSQGLHWIQVDLLTGSERAARQQSEWMVFSAQLAFVALAFIGGLFQLLHTGRRIYLGLIGFTTQFLLYRLNMNGLLIDAWGQSAQDFVALSTALTVTGLTGFALLVPLFYWHPSPAKVWTSSKRLSVGAALALSVLAFALPRGPVMLAASLLASVVLLETAYHLGRLWYARMGKGATAPFDYVTVVAYLLLIAACMLLFLGMHTPEVLFLTPPDLRQVGWPVMCTLLFLALVRRQHKQTALQRTALTTAAERLRLEMARRGEQQHFMAMLVHEISGPLTVIELGQRALTQRAFDAEQTAAWAQRMRNATDTIGQIVENCGEVKRLEDGALRATVAEVAVAPVLADTLDRLGHTVPDAAQRIHVLFTPETTRFASCRGDTHFLGTILRNLLANALKYAPAGGAVQLQCSAVQRGGRACIEFAVHNDQGASGAPDPARVFSRYYRAPSATQVSGTGLGLWLSQNLARQMQSEIRLTLSGPKIVFSFTMDSVEL